MKKRYSFEVREENYDIIGSVIDGLTYDALELKLSNALDYINYSEEIGLNPRITIEIASYEEIKEGKNDK